MNIQSSTPSDLFQDHESSKLLELSHSDRQRLEATLKEGWRLTPATLASKITHGRWIAAKHLLHISTIVATEIAKGNARIILTMPFRHGKSEFLSVNTPIWFLEKWPERYVMNLTYGLELATDFSLKVRETFQDEDNHHLLRTRISRKKQRVDRFLTTMGGGLTAAGIGGPIVGRGGDLILLDDYIKNAEDAMNPAHHKKTFEWFKSTAYTRLEPNASMVILATRWAQKDLIGLLLTELAHENWILINLPMHAMVNDPLGRELGEVLWRERYDEVACERIKKTLGPFWYAAQCQQDPPASMAGQDLGDKLKIINKSELPPVSQLKTLRVWDLAATKGDGDFTAGMKISRQKDTGKIFIEDLKHDQWSSKENKDNVKACADADGHGVKVWMEQEPGSSGKTVITDYEDLLKGYSFRGEKATGPIEVRFSPAAAAIGQGIVYMVDDEVTQADITMGRRSWNESLRIEANEFPDGENDDIITTLALGYNKLVLGLSGALTWGRDTVRDNVVPFRPRRVITPEMDKNTPRRSLTW